MPGRLGRCRSGDIVPRLMRILFTPQLAQRIADRFEKYPEVVAVTGRYVYTEPPWWSTVEYVIRLA